MAADIYSSDTPGGNRPVTRRAPRNRISAAVAACLSFLVISSVAHADPGHPVAVRQLPGGSISIETMWNLSVVISGEKHESSSAHGVDILPSGVEVAASNPDRAVMRVGDDTQDYVLDRFPNQAKASWKPFETDLKLSPNAIRVRTFGADRMTLIDVDGVQLAHRDWNGQVLSKDAASASKSADVLVLTSNDSDGLADGAWKKATAGSHNTVVLATQGKKPGNVAVVRATDESADKDPRVIKLTRDPIELSEEVMTLMKKKETACRESQKVFAKLSVAQMNFKPPNGSHTPRWNAEHMMGRELMFFSQIFEKLDPSIPVMDLNPKQMPPDYVARHADWSGQEEAMQMERVLAFTRRFAYLLKDLPLDERAPGSFWTPRRLLLQMDRHYGEHTANVVKKFELEGWPKD